MTVVAAVVLFVKFCGLVSVLALVMDRIDERFLLGGRR
jgi:hypothetical protein